MGKVQAVAERKPGVGKGAPLTLAVRAHTVTEQAVQRRKGTRRRHRMIPTRILTVTCATSPDETERLTFGVYRLLDNGILIDQGIFHADNLPKRAQSVLSDYCSSLPESVTSSSGPTRILSRAEFLKEVFFPIALEARGLTVGYNLPFELSRLAVGWGVARKPPYSQGFSLVLGEYINKKDERVPDRLIPRIAVKPIDSKRSLIGFTSAWAKSRLTGRTPKGSRRRLHRGFFLDARTLAYALTGEDLTLAEACWDFGLDWKASPMPADVSPAGITQLRSRVAATETLAMRLVDEYSSHHLSLPPWEAYSAASIGKAYLREMGVHTPKVSPRPGLGLSADDVQGIAATAYYGGRAECRVRRIPVPVCYCDFLSMYPTVASLMGIWRLLTANEVVVEDATSDIQDMLQTFTADDLYRPQTWARLPAFVLVVPEDDILPTRAKYGRATRDAYTMAVSHVSAPYPMWYTLPDVLDSTLDTGKPPKVLKAISLQPRGKQEMRGIQIPGWGFLDPRVDDFFRRIVEARHGIREVEDLDPGERKVRERTLKDIANSTAYGIFMELNRQDGTRAEVDVYGMERFRCKVSSPEQPGDFYMPILASTVTGGARLMLSLAEYELRKRTGAYAFMDTDSIAIVASREGGLIPCPGGPQRLPNGEDAIRALSWADVQAIVERFKALNTYDQKIIPGSILKLEKENYPTTESPKRERIELWAYVIAAKRYVLFNLEEGKADLRKPSKHGIGAYRPPRDSISGEPAADWIGRAWLHILSSELGLHLNVAMPWARQIAIRDLRIATPKMMKWFAPYNDGALTRRTTKRNRYATSVKPFNRFEHVTLARHSRFGAWRGSEKAFCLVRPAPSARRLGMWWGNLHEPSGPQYRVVTGRSESQDATTCSVKSYGDLVDEHPLQPEPKSIGPDGNPCTQHTRGVLGRRHIWVAEIVHVGKEANDIELVQVGLVQDEDEVLTTYVQDIRDILPEVLALIPARTIQEATGCSRREAFYLRKGKRRPRTRLLRRLIPLAGDFARDELKRLGEPNTPDNDKQAIRRLVNHLRNQRQASDPHPA